MLELREVEMINGRVYYKSPKSLLLKPTNVQYMNQIYNIVKTHPNYWVKEYYIIVNNKDENIIEDIIICNCFHPNAWGGEDNKVYINNPPKFSRFCLPDSIQGSQLVNDNKLRKIQRGLLKKSKQKIVSDFFIRLMIGTWGLDNPHHEPPKEFVTTNPKLPFY